MAEFVGCLGIRVIYLQNKETEGVLKLCDFGHGHLRY